MKQKLLLICALLVSVITLSGAVNRSFRTAMERWNPIGFTQALSESQTTNRLTAGGAILPATAMATPSGVLRGGSENVITFTTAKAVGETIKLRFDYTGAAPTLNGLTVTSFSGTEVTYTLTSQTVTITGLVSFFACTGNQITALDVSKNTALTVLICDNNQLTALNVFQNFALMHLSCSSNQLTALDVSNNTALTWLACNQNKLTTLDVSKNTKLTELNCSENQLTTLNISKNTALTNLWCSYNQLTALDLSQNRALMSVYCYGNQIKGEEITRLVKSLPDRTDKEAGEFIVVQEPAPEGNRCLKTDVAIAKGKNWIVKV